MSQPHIIAFVGTVGVGKSTQIRLLAYKLKMRGLRVKTTSLKTGHLLAYLLEVTLKKTLVRGRKGVSPIRALIEEKPNLFRRLLRLWLTLDVISVFFKFLLDIYVPVSIGYIIVVEEYIPATIADYIYLTKAVGLPPKTTFFVSRFMLRLSHLGGSTQVIFLDADTDRLKSRWSSRGSLDERPDYLHMQRTILFFLSKKFSSHRIIYINTSKQTVKETHDQVTDYLMSSGLE